MIEVVEGDCVRIFITNKLIALITVHWHGMLLPMAWAAPVENIANFDRSVRPDRDHDVSHDERGSIVVDTIAVFVRSFVS